MNWDLQLHIYGAFAIVWYISKETFFYNALRCLPNVPPLLTMSFFFLLFFWCGIRASFLWIYSIMSSLDRICMPYFLGFKNPPRCNCFPPMMRLVKDGYLLIQTRRKKHLSASWIIFPAPAYPLETPTLLLNWSWPAPPPRHNGPGTQRELGENVSTFPGDNSSHVYNEVFCLCACVWVWGLSIISTTHNNGPYSEICKGVAIQIFPLSHYTVFTCIIKPDTAYWCNSHSTGCKYQVSCTFFWMAKWH